MLCNGCAHQGDGVAGRGVCVCDGRLLFCVSSASLPVRRPAVAVYVR